MDPETATMIEPVVDPSATWPPLKRLRKARGLTQKAVALNVPCACGIIHDIEKYNYHPSLEIQQRIAAFFGVARADIWPDLLDSPRC